MQRIGDMDEILLPLEHERRAPRRREPDHAERVCDGVPTISAPSEDPGAELAQGDGAPARSDQSSRPDADLDSRCQSKFLARFAVLPQPGRAVEISDAPLSSLMDQLGVLGRNPPIGQLYLTHGRRPDVP